MKIVVDTNIVISGIFWGGIPNKILTHWFKGQIEVFISPAILEEYEKVLKRIDSGFTANDIQEWVELIITHSSLVTPMEKRQVIAADPDDDKFIECAICCQADYIISGDKHLLNIKEYEGIKIVSPSRFFEVNEDLN